MKGTPKIVCPHSRRSAPIPAVFVLDFGYTSYTVQYLVTDSGIVGNHFPVRLGNGLMSPRPFVEFLANKETDQVDNDDERSEDARQHTLLAIAKLNCL